MKVYQKPMFEKTSFVSNDAIASNKQKDKNWNPKPPVTNPCEGTCVVNSNGCGIDESI